MNRTVSLEHSLDRCVQCGFCLAVCPTYEIFQREESSPRGRIALVTALTNGELAATPETVATFAECVGCRACESACPSGVLYEEVLLAGREALNQVDRASPWNVRIVLFLIQRPALLAALRRAWHLTGPVATRVLQRLPRLPQSLALLRALPVPQTVACPPPASSPDVVLHQGCLMSVCWDGTNAHAVLLLRQSGFRAGLLPSAAGCCGALHGHQGDLDTARKLARQAIEVFERSGAETIISLAGGCAAFMHGYPHLFPTDDSWHVRATALAGAVRDLASLLTEAGWMGTTGSERTTYQDSCHLRHGLRIWTEPRALLQAAGTYTELPNAATCCGSAGVYNLVRPDLANQLLDQKVSAIRETGARTVIVTNPGCELQIRMGLQRAKVPVEVSHLANYLYDRRVAARGPTLAEHVPRTSSMDAT